MVASLGDDDGGALLRDALGSSGVDLSLVSSTDTPTGTAIITVDDSGENSIVVAPGAKRRVVLVRRRGEGRRCGEGRSRQVGDPVPDRPGGGRG
jgi:hypothetical protein